MISESVVPKFINSPGTAVSDALLGLTLTNPNIGVLESTNAVVLRNPSEAKVHLLCGGGSGHEPAHAGYVAEDCLSAAVCGGVFASPPTKHIIKAIEHLSKVNSNKGVLVIIKNYTGDIINFESAIQWCALRGIKAQSLVVNDDIAFIDTDKGRKEARGLCGTVLLYKMLGAAAYAGQSLERLLELGKSILNRTFTLNVSLGACSLPGNPHGFKLEPNCYELGLGIHGQKGKEVRQIGTCKQMIGTMLEKFARVIAYGKGRRVVLLLNNLGGCSELEMGILSGDILTSLKVDLTVERIVVGSLMTSLEMHGISVTMLDLQDEEELKLIDKASRAGGWWPKHPTNTADLIPTPIAEVSTALSVKEVEQTATSRLINSLHALLLKNVTLLDELDRQVGDGDTGQSINRTLSYIDKNNTINRLNFSGQFNESIGYLGDTIAEESAGSLGTIIGRFLAVVASKLNPLEKDNSKETWAQGLIAGIQAVQTIGGCQIGDRTILDVLVPLAQTLEKSSLNGRLLLTELLDCCREECIKISKLKARKGRARYLNGKEIGRLDPGCELIRIVLEGILLHQSE